MGLTLPRALKDQIGEAAAVLAWSVGDWVLAAAAQEGPRLREALGHLAVVRRSAVADATFTALYLTPDERDELDDQAIACGLNRSAFVTAVATLNLTDDLEAVTDAMRAQDPSA